MTMSTYRKITQIEIENYRAFYGKEVILLEKGENLLVYGENGSGKSSLYQALLAFLASTADQQPLAEFVNIWQPAGANANIKVTFHEFDANNKRIDTSEEQFEANSHSFPQYLTKANLNKGFFSYRELLRTHLVDPEEHISFFDLFMQVILKDYIDPGTGQAPKEEWEDVFKIPRNQTEEDDALIVQKVEAFNQRLEANLELIQQELDQIISYFKQGLEVNLVMSKGKFDPPNPGIRVPNIHFEVKLFGQFIDEHYLFLNEARLSALALSVYLAALKTNPTNSEYKIIFLDDTFIGLDMSNRLPLLKIIAEKFADYQVFITTYDREWFEIASHELSGNWKQIEMYAKDETLMDHSDGTRHPKGSTQHPIGSVEINFERPLIIDPSQVDNVANARLYFDLKNYPVAGNYLRKECEKLLRKYLPPHYLLTVEGEEIRMLGQLLIKLREYFSEADLPFPSDLDKTIHLHRKILFNPASHHDLKSSFYKSEIERAFELVEVLKNLKPIHWELKLQAREELTFEDISGKYKARVIVADDVYKTKLGKEEKISKARYYMDWWEYDGIEYYSFKDKKGHSDEEIANMRTQERALEVIYRGITKSLGIPEDKDMMYSHFKTSSKTLKEIFK